MLVRHKFRYLMPCHGSYPDTEGLIDELEAQGGGGDPPATETPVVDPPPAETPAWQAPEFLMLGEEQVPWDKAQIWLSQGRNYSQNAARLNQLEQTYSPFKDLDPQTLARFKEIDAHIQTEEGKAWWNHVSEGWTNRTIPPGTDPQFQQIISPLNQQISQLSETVNSLLTDRQAQEQKQQDDALDSEIKQTRDKFANIDFDQVDESGQSLEARTLRHAAENNFPTFRAAFLDYHHDTLLQISKGDGAAAAATKKEQQARTGIIGKTQTPTKAQSYDHRGKTWDDVMNDAAAELGLE